MPTANERWNDRNAEQATNVPHGTSQNGSLRDTDQYLYSNTDDSPFTLEDINRMRANGLTLADAIEAIEAMDK